MEIPILPGDGIGPEVVAATERVLAAACARTGAHVTFVELPCGLDALSRYGSTIPSATLERLDTAEGFVLGPLTTHAYSGAPEQPNVSALLRRRYDLFANIRPVRRFLPRHYRSGGGPNLDLDLVVVRENTEGFYADRNLHKGPGEIMPDPDTALAFRLITRAASSNVARAAFELAETRSKRLTIVHKANVLRISDGLFVEACKEAGADYPDVEVADLHIDAAATTLITAPREFDVVVTTNMFGDILSNEAAGLVGGLGLLPSLNRSSTKAMAQAAHGSAPALASTDRANPVAAILSGQMLLSWLAARHGDAALASASISVRDAIGSVVDKADAAVLTPDLGGTGTTTALAEALVDAL